jgi:hypothetical protein
MSMFTAPAQTTATEYEVLEDGAYEAILCGMTFKNFKKYQSEELQPKMQFIFQVKEGDTLHYLKTKPMVNSINEKSNLFLCINALTGATLDKVPLGYDYKNLLGWKCQLSVVTKPSAKDPNVTYNEIGGYMKPKKSQKTELVADDKVPYYLNENVLESAWMPGLSFAAKPQQASTFAAPSKAMPAQVATTIGDSSAFFGQGQVSQGFATPNSEVPVAPSNPNYVGGQASAPSPYVAPQRKDGTFVPAPAPAPQPQMFGQATTPAGNTYPTQAAPQVTEDDLPF